MFTIPWPSPFCLLKVVTEANTSCWSEFFPMFRFFACAFCIPVNKCLINIPAGWVQLKISEYSISLWCHGILLVMSISSDIPLRPDLLCVQPSADLDLWTSFLPKEWFIFSMFLMPNSALSLHIAKLGKHSGAEGSAGLAILFISHPETDRWWPHMVSACDFLLIRILCHLAALPSSMAAHGARQMLCLESVVLLGTSLIKKIKAISSRNSDPPNFSDILLEKTDSLFKLLMSFSFVSWREKNSIKP